MKRNWLNRIVETKDDFGGIPKGTKGFVTVDLITDNEFTVWFKDIYPNWHKMELKDKEHFKIVE